MTSKYTPIKVLPLWFPLVKKFYQAHYPSGKPNKSEPIWVIKDGAHILAALRLKPISDDTQLLTAMVTHPDKRQRGLGKNLLEGVQEALASKSTYCFALANVVPFYLKNHFVEVAPETLPSELKSRFLKYLNSNPGLTPMLYVG
ncbi:GNAT family N-acetyltransferase [Marinomonas balearica]|uniref:Acetyltransferase (GNAT) family protein n=1 Tax=Marinomonas balearica TaxID=491947 RepID=A0A4V3CGC9_9GAMM|nr:GNAT family N-acetyltransferase [Marinomonas balearica]TDO97252.1 acetyltransferase (GNAT) family protein [Marinomonas balearica]